MSVVGLSLESYAEDAKNSLVQAERLRYTPSLSDTDNLILEGREAYKNKDYAKAVEHYENALLQLAAGPIAADRRRSYKGHLADGKIALSILKKREESYTEAQALLEDAVKLDPKNEFVQSHLDSLRNRIGAEEAKLITDTKKADADGFVALFDGESLKGWTSARSEGKGDWGPYSVSKEEKAIHVYAGEKQGSEQVTDCLNTDVEFSHYILKLEYKWAGNRFAPRQDWDRDAGLLYHVHGDLTKVWPNCMEMQIGDTAVDSKGRRRFHTGDLFVLGKDLSATTPKDGRFYKKDGEKVEGRSVPTELGKERPMGEWNEIEIRVEGAKKATFIFNGEVVLELFDMKQKVDGEIVPLEKGRIGLQAEWAEILYRNIRIKEMPTPKE